MSNLARPDDPFEVPPAAALFEFSKWPLVDDDIRGMIESLCTEYDALGVAEEHLPWMSARWVKGGHWPIAWLQLVSEKNREVLGPPPELELGWSPPMVILWLSHGSLTRVVDPTNGNLYSVLYHALRSLQEEDGDLVIRPPEIQRFVGEDVDMADWLIKAEQLERQLTLEGPLEGVTEDDGSGIAPSDDPEAAEAVAAATALLRPGQSLCLGGCGTIIEKPEDDYTVRGKSPFCRDCYERETNDAEGD